MAITVATRAGATKPSISTGWSGEIKRAWGIVTYSGGAPLDTFIMCKLPKGALIIGGALKGDKLDSNGSGSALMSVNIGVDKAITTATGTAVTAASTSNCLASAWSLGPDAAAVTGFKPDNNVRNVPLGSLLLTDGPLLCSDECNAYITINASALAITTGDMILEVDYLMSQHS